jgi:hypothetical protein
MFIPPIGSLLTLQASDCIKRVYETWIVRQWFQRTISKSHVSFCRLVYPVGIRCFFHITLIGKEIILGNSPIGRRKETPGNTAS